MKELDYLKNLLSSNGALDEPATLAVYEVDRQLTLFNNLVDTLFNSELHLVYMHTTPDGKKYIGITKNLPNTRWNEGSGYEGQKKFYKAIQAFGWINIEHRIVAAGLTEIEAKELETKLILEYRTNEPEYGYNTNLSIAKPTRKKEKISHSRVREKRPEKEVKPDIDICREIIDKYSIRTVDKAIYYLTDSGYTEGSDSIIEKELIEGYQVLTRRKRKEIIESIKILSASKIEEVFPEAKLSAEEQESQVLLDAFSSSGYSRVTVRDINALRTWLDETDEQYICIPMIWDRVLHLSGKSPSLISKLLGKYIRNHGWVSHGTRRYHSKYGPQRSYYREVPREVQSKSD